MQNSKRILSRVWRIAEIADTAMGYYARIPTAGRLALEAVVLIVLTNGVGFILKWADVVRANWLTTCILASLVGAALWFAIEAWRLRNSRRMSFAEKTDSRAIATNYSNHANLKNITVTPDDDGAWAWLRVDNNGPTGKFQVSVELLDTGEKEHSYHPPWRDNGAQVLEIVKGDEGKINIAEIDPLQTQNEVVLRFYTTANSEGKFCKTFPVPSTIHCRITVFHMEQGPVAQPREYVLQIESTDRLRFFGKAGMKQGEQPQPRAERTYIGEGVWWEVKWRGFRLMSGRIDAEGPLCIYDDTPLRYKGSGLPESVEDYQEVRPPSSYLLCPACKKKYYLDATDTDFKRVGDARNYAAWRLGGGRTVLEELIDRAGLS
jgi:hypothetical protein